MKTTNLLSSELSLVAIHLMSELENITLKETFEDNTHIESFYYEEISLYCRINGVCRVIRVINKKNGIVIGLVDTVKPWTYSEFEADELIDYIKKNP